MANGFNTKNFAGTSETFLTLNVNNTILGVTGHAGVNLLLDAAGQNLAAVSAAGAQLVDQQNPATGTTTQPATSTTDATLIASNANRKGGTIHNLSAANLYVRFAAGAASQTVFSVKLPSGGYCEIPAGYTGIVHGILDAGTGTAACTEFTP